MKLPKIFKKNEELNPNEEKTKNTITIGIYIAIFIIALLFVKLTPPPETPSNKEPNSNSETSEVNEIITMLEPYKTYNYYQKTKIISDLGIITVELEKLNENEVGKKISTSLTEYIYYNGKHYILTESSINEDSTFKPFDNYDRTFIDMNNIIKLIQASNSTVDLIEETYQIKRYKISLSEVVRIYNEINKTSVAVSEANNIIIEVNYNEGKLHSLILDLTNLYKLVDNKEYTTLTYEIEYDKLNEIDLTGIEKLIN